VTQVVLAGPFKKLNLRDGFWPQPNRLLYFLSVEFFPKS